MIGAAAAATSLLMDDIDIDCGNYFFDHIDDLLDFPEDNHNHHHLHHHHNDNHNALVCVADDSFPPTLWGPNHPSDDVFPPSSHHVSDLSAQLAVPYEDIVQMEWLSTFVEDSFSGGSMTTTTTTIGGDDHKQDYSSSSSSSDFVNNNNHSHQFHSSSPVSVLESSSSSTQHHHHHHHHPAPPPPTVVPGRIRCGRARSKRPRPPTFNPRLAMHLISIPGGHDDNSPPPPLINKNNIPTKPKKKKTTPKLPLLPGGGGGGRRDEKKEEEEEELLQSSQTAISPGPWSSSVRKCKHCEITKTPQWRAGPMGPKTLCNACGVRYKSGRLFPEYRPAASPTFVASQHSNSHKKVVEMRNKVVGVSSTTDTSYINSINNPGAADDTDEVVLIPNIIIASNDPAILLLDYI